MFNYMGLTLAVAIALVSVATVHAEDKFQGEFWSKGKHFQLNGEVVLVAEDGIHDPSNNAVATILQQPFEAMVEFPRDQAGLIDWVQALEKGLIAPRKGILGDGELQSLDMDIVLTNTGAMPNVRFPHRQHTEWLACENCHPKIFEAKKGANKITMPAILQGQFCGLCHGKVAFAPTKNCARCHSVPKGAANAK
jgi:c(7)-type cytochrome triheme protein